MRVAIAGTGGLAYWIAHHIRAQTGHQLVLLSRNVRKFQRYLQISTPLMIDSQIQRLLSKATKYS